MNMDKYIKEIANALSDSALIQFKIFNNSALDWMLAFTLGVLFYLAIRRVVSRFKSFQRDMRLSSQKQAFAIDLVRQLAEGTHFLFALALSLWVASQMLDLSAGVSVGLHRLMVIAMLIQAGSWGAASLSIIAGTYAFGSEHDARARDAGRILLLFVGKMLVWSFVVLLILDNFGVDITALVAGLGVGGVAVALAMQNILGDLFASLSIVLDRPFAVDDFIVVDDYLGTIERIGIKTTRVRSLSGEQLIFSNSDLLTSRIRNFKRMEERRVLFSIGVTYDTDPALMRKIPAMIQEIVQQQSPIRFDRAHFKEFGDSALQFEVVYYVLSSDFNVYMDIQQSINQSLLESFDEAGIEFAFPTRTLKIDSLIEKRDTLVRSSNDNGRRQNHEQEQFQAGV